MQPKSTFIWVRWKEVSDKSNHSTRFSDQTGSTIIQKVKHKKHIKIGFINKIWKRITIKHVDIINNLHVFSNISCQLSLCACVWGVSNCLAFLCSYQYLHFSFPYPSHISPNALPPPVHLPSCINPLAGKLKLINACDC